MRRAFLQRLATLAGTALAWPAWAQFEVSPWAPGLATPPLQALDLQGKTWRLADLKGRAVLLNFWASWCEPCRAEMPTLQQLADLYGEDRLLVLAVNFKESASRAAQFARSTGLQLPVLLDPAGAAARQWGVNVFPSTVLIGSDGQPRQRVRGEMDWTGGAADRLVRALFEPAPARPSKR